MKPEFRYFNALWETAEADALFSSVLKKIQCLHQQSPDELNGAFVELIDEFHAAHSRLQTAKYDLLILFRAEQ